MIFMQFKRHFVYLIVYTVAYSVYLPPTGRSRRVKNIACSAELLPRAPVSVLRGHDYKLTKRDCHSHARLSFFSFRVVTSWNNLPSDVVSAPSLNTFKGRLDKYWGHHCYSLDPSVFVRRQVNSRQVTLA